MEKRTKKRKEKTMKKSENHKPDFTVKPRNWENGSPEEKDYIKWREEKLNNGSKYV